MKGTVRLSLGRSHSNAKSLNFFELGKRLRTITIRRIVLARVSGLVVLLCFYAVPFGLEVNVFHLKT